MSDLGRDEERDLMAAEYSLGLLEGHLLVEARRLLAEDDDFARAVAAWDERLAPLMDDVPAVPPGAEMWGRIEAAIAEAPPADNVVQLHRKVRLWRGYGAAATAVAASLALVVGYQSMRDDPSVAPPAAMPTRAPVLVATLASEEADTSLSVAYDRANGSLLVTPGRLVGAAGHDHELWIIPAGGSPVSLGLVRPGDPVRIRVPESYAPHFQVEAGVALSVEPEGGSPTGQPTGPVVAAGELLLV